MNALLEYDWPGNVRELENCVERAVALGADDLLDINDLPPVVLQQDSASVVVQRTDTNESEKSSHQLSDSDLEELERATIMRVFQQVNGDKTLAGKMLGISRATLYRKLKRYNIKRAKASAAAV
jgi:DNA-binding NtrC family response regulator